MSWCVNQGPSFNTFAPASATKLNGFYQRFQLMQDDNRMTPGKREVKVTSKGLRKKDKQVKYSDSIPKGQAQPIYSGFSNIKNKATKQIKRRGGKLKKRVVR